MLRTLAAVSIAVSLAGCAARSPKAVAGAPGPRSLFGETKYAFVPDRNAPRISLKPNEEIRSPRPEEENPVPLYPQAALLANAGRAVVGLRIVIDPNGAVIEVTDSPVVASTAGSWQAAFREAAVAAVGGWRFHPAEFRRNEPGEDYDGDGRPDFDRVTLLEPIAVYLDIRFEFAILDGKGVVTGGLPPAPTT